MDEFYRESGGKPTFSKQCEGIFPLVRPWIRRPFESFKTAH